MNIIIIILLSTNKQHYSIMMFVMICLFVQVVELKLGFTWKLKIIQNTSFCFDFFETRSRVSRQEVGVRD